MVDSQHTTSRRLLLLFAGFVLFAVGVSVGLFTPTLIPALRPGDAPKQPVAPPGDEGLLVQTGEIDPRNKPDDFDVLYPRPYATAPELKIVDAGPMVIYKITEQWPHGFRLNVTGRRLDDALGKYQARGVAAK